MEFLTGYAAAKAPYLTYEFEGPSDSRSKPARSNSTSGTGRKKRSRIPGHARTNSASTSSSGGRTEQQAAAATATAQAQAPLPHYAGGWLQQTPATADANGIGPGPTGAAVTSSPGGRADPTTEQHQQQQQQQQQQQPPPPQHHRTARRNSTRDRDWMSSGLKYFQDKQLPATPRLNTHDAAGASYPGAGHPSEPAAARTPASATATTAGGLGNPGAVVAAVSFPDRRHPHSTMVPYMDAGSGKLAGGGSARAESISSVSGATTTSSRTMHSTDPPADSVYQLRPFVVRNGRTYLADPTLPYPLPVDLEELHRQSLKTMLLMQLYGRPICAPAFANKPPSRILEVGCGTGFWSMMCYKHYEARGQHKDMHFTGIDIVPLPPNAAAADSRPDKDMNWRFVQHDLRKLPLPFPNGSFDFVMAKDMALATTMLMQQRLIEEYIRVLTPGGTIEIWETDQMVRMLRPHVPDYPTTSGPIEDDLSTAGASAAASINDDVTNETDENTNNNDTAITTNTDATTSTPTNGTTTTTTTTTTATTTSKDPDHLIGGAYIMTPNTPLSTPLNNFLVEYNLWVSRALEARALCTMPCTAVGPLLVQEAEALAGGVGSRRLAVPLSEVRWEKEGVGGVVTKDGKSYIESKAMKGAVSVPPGSAGAAASGGDGGGDAVAGAGAAPGSGSGSGSSASGPGPAREGAGGSDGGSPGRVLEPAGAALRRTALMIVVQCIQGLEPMLREASGKSQDEWDTWLGKMMNDLVRENGTSWGECLEVGAWWAKKK